MKSQPVLPLRPSSVRKQRAILTAAQECFVERGYEATTLDEVAAQAGVSKQTVYTRFGNKETLFVHVVTLVTTQAFDALATGGSDDRVDDVRTWLVGVANRLLSSVLDPRVVRLRQLVIAEAARFPGLARAFWEQGAERTIDALADRIAGLHRRRLLTAPDARVAASTFNWLVLSEPLNRQMLLGDAPAAPLDIAAHAAEAVRVFLAAYGREPRTGDR